MSVKQKGAPDWWNNDQWATPTWFVQRLAIQFVRPLYADKPATKHSVAQFDLDPCADKRTAKAPRYFTQEMNGLTKKWRGRVFVNPPFSNPAPWCRKAALQIEKGNAELVVMLLPCSMATNWFHEWVLPYAEVHYIKGRLAFLDWKNREKGGNRTDCFIAVYRRGPLKVEYITMTFDSKQ